MLTFFTSPSRRQVVCRFKPLSSWRSVLGGETGDEMVYESGRFLGISRYAEMPPARWSVPQRSWECEYRYFFAN